MFFMHFHTKKLNISFHIHFKITLIGQKYIELLFLYHIFWMTWISQHFSSIPTLEASKTNSLTVIISKFGTQMK